MNRKHVNYEIEKQYEPDESEDAHHTKNKKWKIYHVYNAYMKTADGE